VTSVRLLQVRSRGNGSGLHLTFWPVCGLAQLAMLPPPSKERNWKITPKWYCAATTISITGCLVLDFAFMYSGVSANVERSVALACSHRTKVQFPYMAAVSNPNERSQRPVCTETG